MAAQLIGILILLLWAVSIVIVVQAIMSWLVAFNVINTHSDFVRSLLYTLDRLTSPLYRPIRKVLPDFGGIDFSPLVVLLLIMLVQRLLESLAMQPGIAG